MPEQIDEETLRISHISTASAPIKRVSPAGSAIIPPQRGSLPKDMLAKTSKKITLFEAIAIAPFISSGRSEGLE